MPESIRTRRRWPWVVLATAILLIGGRVAWRFRPLNATERALVGRWGNAKAGPRSGSASAPAVAVSAPGGRREELNTKTPRRHEEHQGGREGSLHRRIGGLFETGHLNLQVPDIFGLERQRDRCESGGFDLDFSDIPPGRSQPD